MNTKQVRRQLLMATGCTYREWAAQRNYNPRTVTQAVQRWAGKKQPPRGHLTFRILRDLSREIGREISPGILRSEA